MIVDLNLQGKTALVIGGGAEAEKRINGLLPQGCKIIVLSEDATAKIKKLVKTKKIEFHRDKISKVSVLSQYKPDLVITTTNDSKLNQKILQWAKKRKVIRYSSDDPDSSDFSNGSIIDFEDTVKIAIFTGGKSPAMSKKLRIDAEKVFKKIISKQDIGQIKIQQIARQEAKEALDTQKKRKSYLQSVMNDKEIKQLIKDGQLKKAENRARSLLRKRYGQ